MANKRKVEAVCGLLCAGFLLMGLTIYHAAVTSNDVPGTYSVRYPFGDGVLQLWRAHRRRESRSGSVRESP